MAKKKKLKKRIAELEAQVAAIPSTGTVRPELPAPVLGNGLHRPLVSQRLAYPVSPGSRYYGYL